MNSVFSLISDFTIISSLTQQEQLKAQQGVGVGISPVSLNSGDSKEVDILRMLTKAKDEYTKVRGLFFAEKYCTFFLTVFQLFSFVLS